MASRTYMIVDPRRDHSFRIPRPDLTVKIGTPNACNGCHTNRSAAWAATAGVKWYGPSLRSPQPHYGEALYAGRRHLADAMTGLLRLVDDTGQAAIVRATGLSLLREYLRPASLPAVERALADPSPMVRQAALSVLDGAEPATRVRLAPPHLRDPVRGVRIEPGFIPGYVNLADVLRAEGRDNEGEKVLRKALKHDPRNAQVHYSLGLLLARQKRMREAIAALRKATELDPSEPRFAYVFGVALNSAGSRAEALAVLRQAHRRNPAHRDLLIGLTTISRDAGDIASAVEYARALVQLMPEDASAQALVRELEALQR